MSTDLRLAGSPNAQRRCGVSRGWRTERWWTARRSYFFFLLVLSRVIWVVDQRGKNVKVTEGENQVWSPVREVFSRHRDASTVTLRPPQLRSAGEPEESCCPGEGCVTSHGAGPKDTWLPPNAVFVYLYSRKCPKGSLKIKKLSAKKNLHGF